MSSRQPFYVRLAARKQQGDVQRIRRHRLLQRKSENFRTITFALGSRDEHGRPIKIPFLWRHKFPLGCGGHVSKFPIQSLCYPCFGHLKSSGLITRLKCVTLVPRASHLTTSWGERGETLVWAGHVLLWQLKTLGRKGKRIREGSSTIRQFVALSFVTATAINRDV